MKRRDFIKLLAASGMSTGMVPMLSPKSFAAGEAGGPDQYLIVIGADGGWDLTAFFDPKGQADGVNRVDVNPSLVTKNGIQWSAIPEGATNNPDTRTAYADQYAKFFSTYDDNLTIIKGLDTMTVSHIVGSRAKLTGRLTTSPGLASLYAATHGQGKSLSFLTFGSQYGGTDETAGLEVTKALLGTNPALISDLANTGMGQTQDINALIEQEHLKRLQRQIAFEQGSNGLPLRAKKLEELMHQRTQQNLFTLLKDNYDQLEQAVTRETSRFHWYPTRGHSSRLKTQASITAASIATGLTSTASLTLSGFDSHDNNDPIQFLLLTELVEGINYLVNALDFFGLADKTTIVVASDIGRIPGYNSTNGKDHSNYGGMMVLHPKGSGRGGKVFGETDHLSRGVPIDFNTGLPNDHGTRLNVQHMMVALNDHLGVTETANAANLGFDSRVLMPNVFL